MNIRSAKPEDFPTLYELAACTPELRVTDGSSFMQQDEFLWAIKKPTAIFLVAIGGAEAGQDILGFVYANMDDRDVGYKQHAACISYLVVKSESRSAGVGSQLYAACEQELRAHGITYVYTWAKDKCPIIPFFEKKGMTTGHTYVWMDKKLD